MCLPVSAPSRMARPANVHRLVLGGFYESNQSALCNPRFRPFTAPVPFLLMRRADISDLKFFWTRRTGSTFWAPRYGETGVQALAEELRRLPWRARRDQPTWGRPLLSHCM